MLNITMSYLGRLKFIIMLLVVLAIVNIIDIYSDLIKGDSVIHILEETFMVIVFLVFIAFLIKTLAENTKKLELLSVELENIKQINEKQTKEMKQARADYSGVIRQQFKEWNLSKVETEIGFLLLKGLSLKTIANFRQVTEKTTRQQASNIYIKAGVAGRHELAGWFFEDIKSY